MAKAAVVKMILGIAIFATGGIIFLYPVISGLINEQSQTRAIDHYEEAVTALSDDDKTRSIEAAKSYNEALAQTQEVVVDPFGENAATESAVTEISFAQVGEMLGYIQIPKIGVKSPIYEGTSEEVLQKGIGWLTGTSLPVGGPSTNSVLSGHRGLPTAKLFTDLDQVEINDEFYVRNNVEILAYRVIDVKIIDPSESEALKIEEGRDRMTLLTCHPYMVNSHRLLVIGERVPYTGQLDEVKEQGNPLDNLTPAEKDLGITALVIGGFLLIALLVAVRSRRKRKKNEGSDDVGEKR